MGMRRKINSMRGNLRRCPIHLSFIRKEKKKRNRGSGSGRRGLTVRPSPVKFASDEERGQGASGTEKDRQSERGMESSLLGLDGTTGQGMKSLMLRVDGSSPLDPLDHT